LLNWRAARARGSSAAAGVVFAVLAIACSPFGVPELAAQEATYRIAHWEPDSLGNHRAMVRVRKAAPAVRIRLPWRRRDLEPEKKGVWVVDARTGARITNVAILAITREAGEIAFEPVSGAGDYYIYYLRYTGSIRSNYPKITYMGPDAAADTAWLNRTGLGDSARASRGARKLPEAELVAFEAVDDFNRMDPMEVIATAEETRRLLDRRGNPAWLVFPEERRYPIRMTRDLPLRWVRGGATTAVRGSAARGEFFAFQLGVWAARASLEDVRVDFGPLSGPRGVIGASGFRCLNLGGIDWKGRPFTTRVDVPEGRVLPLWCGLQISRSTAAGRYAGSLMLRARDQAPVPVDFTIDVSGDTVRNAGDDDPARLSRLRWLDSRLAADDEVVAPYTPVTVRSDTLGVLGRELLIAQDGLPAAIRSFFTIEMTSIGPNPREVLAAPVRLVLLDSAGRELPRLATGRNISRVGPGAVAWAATNRAGPLDLEINGRLEFDGHVEFTVAVRAREAVSLRDIRLELPFLSDVARYAMGLGLRGGGAPGVYDWTWDSTRNQDGAWLGDVNAGVQFSLRDDRYSRPLNTNFYLSKPLVMPRSWANDGKGGCRLRGGKEAYQVICFSGARTMAAGEVQRYDFQLLLTPFHPIQTKAQWATRYFHAYVPLDSVARMGANTVNVHHATAINPWINYPFLATDGLSAYVDSAHARGMRVKIYYTVRELTNHAPELFALRSLGDEVIAPGPGGGFSWLQEHLGDDYIAAWHVPENQDAAVINTGISRWHNFYVEGLRWLVENTAIDGLYIDDVAFDRSIMKRVRKVLARGRPAPLIDLHSANQFNPRDGFANSANLYLEHFPYIDRLWFGEYFDYNAPPEFWLTEMSGIPFGLMGEMLQDGGNPWRGMLFGMTSRLPWSGDPRELWRFFDAFGMADTRMIGFWVPGHPIRTGRSDVLATVYQGASRSIVSLGSWAADTVALRPEIDWTRLGLDPVRARIFAPALPGFQPAVNFRPGEPILVAPGKGWLLVLEAAATP
jgi:Glycoside hydrolase 123, N-terminal domain